MEAGAMGVQGSQELALVKGSYSHGYAYRTS